MTKPKRPRVLFFDIETSPILALIWKPGSKINVSHEQIVPGERVEIICVSYKFQGESKVYNISWDMKKRSSEKLVKEFNKVVESADVVMAHNGDGFDIKHINTQRWLHGQDPILWPTSEDTLKMFRKHFALPSYRLDYISKLLWGSGKTLMHWNDWMQIKLNRSQPHLDKMIKYCNRDVRLLEKNYKSASKFFTVKAHRGLIVGADRDSCPHCASEHVHMKSYKVTTTGKYKQMQCQSCGHYFKGRKV